MKMRTRKLIGTVLLTVFLGFYVLIAMAVTTVHLQGTHWLLEFIGYLVAGTAWFVPAAALVSWMVRPD